MNSSEYTFNLVYFADVILRKQLYSILVQREEKNIADKSSKKETIKYSTKKNFFYPRVLEFIMVHIME